MIYIEKYSDFMKDIEKYTDPMLNTKNSYIEKNGQNSSWLSSLFLVKCFEPVSVLQTRVYDFEY